MHNCIVCGKEIYTQRKTCSDECRRAWKSECTKRQMTPESRENISKKNGRSNNSGWKGGVSPRTYQSIAFEDYKKDRVCEICKGTHKISVHHKDRNHSNNSEENLQILCDACHKRLHIAAGDMGQGYKTHKTKPRIEHSVVVDMLNSGKSVKEIAESLGYTKAAVRYKLRKFGIRLPQNTRVDINTDEIVELYQKGLSMEKIAEMFGATHTLVKTRLEKRGVKRRNKRDAFKNQYKTSKYRIALSNTSYQ